jgi:branched-chain amino acid transport system permease protein
MVLVALPSAGLTGLVVVVLNLFFHRTLLGKAMRAVAANPIAARLVGIRVKNMILLAFALSAAIGAVGGVIITPIALVDYDRGSLLALKGFAAAILGGIGSFPGAVAAGILLGVLESLGTGLISSHYKDAIALVVLLAMLFIRPAGILGSREASKLKEF